MSVPGAGRAVDRLVARARRPAVRAPRRSGSGAAWGEWDPAAAGDERAWPERPAEDRSPPPPDGEDPPTPAEPAATVELRTAAAPTRGSELPLASRAQTPTGLEANAGEPPTTSSAAQSGAPEATHDREEPAPVVPALDTMLAPVAVEPAPAERRDASVVSSSPAGAARAAAPLQPDRAVGATAAPAQAALVTTCHEPLGGRAAVPGARAESRTLVEGARAGARVAAAPLEAASAVAGPRVRAAAAPAVAPTAPTVHAPPSAAAPAPPVAAAPPPPVVIERIEVVTPPAPAARADPLASLGRHRAGASLHEGLR